MLRRGITGDSMDETPPEGSTIAAELKIDATLITKLNLADFQNAVPLVRDLSLINETDQTHEQVELVLTSDPPFLKPRRWQIDALAARSRYPIRDLDLNLDGGLLARLTEAETATVSLALRTAGADASSPALTQRDVHLELLPRNQWGGISHLPDLVAAFVQPNDPAVDRLLKRTAEVLRQHDRNPALDGYAGGAKRAWELASALWGATAGMQLDYALPPASFEQSGQKVRSPGQIESSGLGTCFDLALLFCAALEQAGLNPLLVFTEGHAFAGVWLQPEEFSTTVVDDVTALRKRLRLKELVLFETTLITQRPTAPFSYATARGAQQVDESQDAGFRLAVDIRRARLQRIKPLASAEAAVATASDTLVSPSTPALPKFEDAPDLPDSAPANAEDASQLDPKDRLLRWQRKLLDLSLRNNLLNFKGGKKALKLEAPDPGALEDLVASGQTLKLRPRPDLMDGADPRDQAIYETREHENVRRAHALEALQKREVFVGVPETELDARLTELFRSARTTLQEGGANTLYLALGFLSWTREDRDGQRYRAPLILVPVSLQRKSARSGFTLSLHDDEPRLEPYFAESELEPLFVKNLESVQGDERDLIYFSITYGPDPTGQLAMNFGPLNRQGGERRLNVAITRARHELRVFASFRAEQMDLARTQAIGVRDLKHFLEFAERGARALAEASKGSLGGFDSPFEQAVATALAQRGWQVQPQIGASSFRVDLGIVDPDAPGRYLAGVECDGATYHRSATARDRDKLREQVLRGLGWEIVRVWSTDWWIDPAGTLDRLDARLRAVLIAQRERRIEEAEREAEAERVAQAAIAQAMASVTKPDEEPAAPIKDADPIAPETPATVPPQQIEEVFAGQASAAPAHADTAETPRSEVSLYRVTNPGEAVDGANPDRFFDGDYNDTLSAMIAHVIDHEGPVLDALLARRIARAHGWLRTGGRIRERVFQIARARYRTTDEEVGTFYWPEHLDPAAEPPFRGPADEDSVRAVDEISNQELASLARAVMAQGTEGDAVYHEMARRLGLQQLRASSRIRLERAVHSTSH